MEKKSKIQKVEKLNKATIEFTSESGYFRIIINDQVREGDEGFTMPKNEMRKLARTFAKAACLCYEACERDFEEEDESRRFTDLIKMLTWQDIQKIINIADKGDFIDPLRLQGLVDNDGNGLTPEEYYTAILNKFSKNDNNV